MKVSVRGHLFDLLAFRGLAGKRRKRIARASPEPLPVHPVNQLAQQLHPARLHLVITSVKDETQTTKTFRLRPDVASGNEPLPYFRAGQYLSVKAEVDGVRITRPYSISSAPFEALGENGFYEITVRKVPDGFLTGHIWNYWRVGTRVESSAPVGFFYFEPLRDARKIVGFAGGSGITPFRSMAREIVYGDLNAELLLFYGSSDEQDIIFYDEFKELEEEAAGRVRVVHVLSCDIVSLEGCERGFITIDLVQKYADIPSSSFFICGPQAMYAFVETELGKLHLPRRRARRESYGEIKDINAHPAFPISAANETFRIKVYMDGKQIEIPARAVETVLVAMERANLAPPSQCRSGECGFCRSLLLSGEVFIVPESDGRRAADKRLGFIHPCSSYPLSDLEIKVPSET